MPVSTAAATVDWTNVEPHLGSSKLIHGDAVVIESGYSITMSTQRVLGCTDVEEGGRARRGRSAAGRKILTKGLCAKIRIKKQKGYIADLCRYGDERRMRDLMGRLHTAFIN